MLRKFQRRPVFGSLLLPVAIATVLCFPALDSLGAKHRPSSTLHARPKAAKLKLALGKPAQPSLENANLRNWGLDNQEYPSHIEAKRAWKLTEGSRKVVVAVIDTGIDANHPDLRDNLWRRKGTDEFGFDFVSGRKNPGDENGHGTHIAGIIGATLANRSGAAGVSPRVSIMPVKYYADGASGAEIMTNIVKAIDYAVENGAQIINFSSEGTGFNLAEFRALERAERKGVLVVTAAGNQGQNNDTSATPCYPASYELGNILAVAATNIRNELLPVSNYGGSRVHVAAPGENIFSTLHKGRYGYLTGTSQATAFVSGVAALMLSENPNLKPSELKKMIMASVDRVPELEGKVVAGGRINAYKAVQLALEARGLPGAPQRKVAASRR